MTSRSHTKLITAVSAIAMLQSTTSLAAPTGTLAGTTVINNATVNFSVGGVAQTPVISPDDSFLVDRRVNLNVSESGSSTTTVTPGSINQITTFVLTNTTNDTLDFSLAAAQDVGGTAAHGGTDNFNANNIRIFVDNPVTGLVGTYDAGDTLTYVDELASGDQIMIFVLADIPLQANGDIASLTLTATAASGGATASQGADLIETVGGNTAGVDTVFDDAAGDTDLANDGKSSDDDDYTVSAATLALVKTSLVISDPVRGVTNPLAIPGAVVEYCIEVANSGSAAATGVNLSDTLPGETTWASGGDQNFRVGGAKALGVCDDTGSVEDDDAVGGDESDPTGGSHSAGVVSALIPTVAAGASTTVKFRVTVD